MTDTSDERMAAFRALNKLELDTELGRAIGDLLAKVAELEGFVANLRTQREAGQELQNTKSERIAKLEAAISQSPVQRCQEERAAGKGGCGACALCGKESNECIAKLEAEVERLKQERHP